MLVLFSTYKGFGTLSPRGNAFKADDSKGESNKLRSGWKEGKIKLFRRGLLKGWLLAYFGNDGITNQSWNLYTYFGYWQCLFGARVAWDRHNPGSVLWSGIYTTACDFFFNYTAIGNVKCTFDVVIVSITTKPYILQKILNQWICCKCLAW